MEYKPFLHLTNLQRLHYNLEEDDCFPPDFFTTMPTSITWLTIGRSFQAWLGGYPPFELSLCFSLAHFVALRTLSVEYLGNALQNIHLEALPRSLTQLTLSRDDTNLCILDAEILEANFPPLLRYISLWGSLPPGYERPKNLHNLIDFLVS